MKDLSNTWNQLLKNLKQIFSKQIYETWLMPLKPIAFNNNTLTLEVPNTFFLDWIKKHYLSFIENNLRDLNASFQKVDLVVSVDASGSASLSSKEMKSIPKPSLKKEIKNSVADSNLNPKYSFDNFVVGSCNRFAHAACVAVAQSPAKSYNPLFIYGGVGLGKTHLMHAIGQYIFGKNPLAKVVYISSEEFTNFLIDAIQKRSTLKFRNKFRTVDVLLLDDIQFLSGKEQTQEEFFHTFNTLYDARKQIVLSSDRPPKEIPNLEERLVSRFEWGLVTDLQFPDTETRIAILKKKAELSNLNVPDEIIYFLAEKIKTNIRKLEGALIRVVSYASLMGSPLTITMAEEVLQDLILVEEESTITINNIQTKVSEHFEVKLSDLRSKKRSKAVVIPRQIAMYLARELTPHSLTDIGSAFGGKDHTTIIHAIKKIESNIKNDTNFEKTITNIQKKIKK